MTATSPPPPLEDIEQFAKRHGLTALSQEHLERLRELAPGVAALGCKLPRPPKKSDPPAASFRVLPERER